MYRGVNLGCGDVLWWCGQALIDTRQAGLVGSVNTQFGRLIHLFTRPPIPKPVHVYNV